MRRILEAGLILAAMLIPLVAHGQFTIESAPTFKIESSTDPSSAAVYVHRQLVSHGDAGSGTVIASEGGKSLVLTCAHVIEGDGGITVTHAGKVYPAKYLGGSTVRWVNTSTIQVDGPDLALVVVYAELPAVEIGSEPETGARVRLFGFGGRLGDHGFVAKLGQVIAGPAFTKPTLTYTASTTSGDSGAGVFNEAGELIGVHTGRSGVQAYAVPVGTVKTFVLARLNGLFPRLGFRLAAVRGGLFSIAPAAAKPPAKPQAPAPKATAPKAEPVKKPSEFSVSPAAAAAAPVCVGGTCIVQVRERWYPGKFAAKALSPR